MLDYKTKQRQILTDYLSEHADEAISAQQIAATLENKSISISAVYRNLSDMEKLGVVRRFTKNGSRNVFYQFVGNPHCHGQIHLSCKKCGRMYHMDQESSEQLFNCLVNKNKFVVDKTDTVLYGICAACQ